MRIYLGRYLCLVENVHRNPCKSLSSVLSVHAMEYNKRTAELYCFDLRITRHPMSGDSKVGIALDHKSAVKLIHLSDSYEGLLGVVRNKIDKQLILSSALSPLKDTAQASKIALRTTVR